GKIEAVIKKYVNDLEPQLKRADRDAVFITHSGVDAAILEAVKAELTELKHFDNIYITRAGGVISSHCGPGTLGVLFIEND
ncbi:MAG: DegV family protein, partial [Oscillospiraceae bacterium]|nr:DegV family protein [Oscillospiraceae bacterium]